MTAGCDDDIPRILFQHPVVFLFHDRRADSRFLHIRKAQALQGLPHVFDADPVIIGNEGRRQAYIDRIPGLQQHTDLFCLVHDLFRILRTDHKAMTAKDAFISDDMCLSGRKTDGFHRTMPDTFVTVPTV